MVFEWVTSKFKERQLKKAQIQAEADHMVIISGLSILNPTWRTFFKRTPFYDLETDSIDFKKLENYLTELRINQSIHSSSHCKDCLYHKWCDEDIDKLSSEIKYESERLDYTERVELEHLKSLFMILTGETEYYHYSDFNNLKPIIKEYREQYRNLDETISNFENKIYQKNKEIERLQHLLNDSPVQNVVKIVEKEPTKDNRPIKRSDKIYRMFKLRVLKRDKVCQCCGATENIHVHHLSSFALHNSRGADTDNGIALCEDCHKEYHRIHGKLEDNNPVNFAKFMREYGNAMQVNLDYEIPSDNIFEEVLGGK